MKVTNIVFDGIDYNDSPDFCDAYIISCDIDGVEATEVQLDELNEDRDFVHEKLYKYMY